MGQLHLNESVTFNVDTFAGPTHILIEESNVIALRRAGLLDALPIQKPSPVPLLRMENSYDFMQQLSFCETGKQ